MNKQTHFESTDALENATVMLDACRAEYERAGHREAARSITGLDVTSLASAHLALVTINGLPGSGDLAIIRGCAVAAIQEAVSTLASAQCMAS